MRRARVAALMPLYLWTLLFVLLPMGYVVVLSLLTRSETIGGVLPLTFANYASLAGEANLSILLKSLNVAIMTTVASLLLGYPFALILTNRPARRRSLLLLLVVVPFWTSALLRIYGWMIVFRGNGLVNTLLSLAGLGSVKFLYTPAATVFGMVYTFLPFMILPIFSSLEKRDAALPEAARDLGANPVTAFLTVTLPLSLPGILSGCVMVFVPSLGMFFISDLMGGGTDMLLGNLVNHFFHGGRNWPVGASMSVLLIAMSALGIRLFRRYAGGESLGVF